MERQVDMNEVSDGKKYTSNDMAKLGCEECAGCFSCCQGMGQSIILDPYDVYELTTHIHCTMDALLEEKLDLGVVDGIILPHLKLSGEKEECPFLDRKGRCSIHSFRPGFCRLFPLGRIYEKGSFYYFLQVNECQKGNRTKVKIKKWLGISNLGEYENFINQWHYFLKDITELLRDCQDPEQIRQMNMYIIQLFFLKEYDSKQTFYEQFQPRLQKMKHALGQE